MEDSATTPDVRRLADLGATRQVIADLEMIMLEASGRAFAPGPEREAFVERWLGRFLTHDPDKVLVLVTPDGSGGPLHITGYLVGATDNPALTPRFADLAYFETFAGLCRLYPAHLHINLRPAARGHGHGGQLIEAFASIAREAGACGMHVVTAAAARNVRFYARLGFVEAGRALWNGREIVLLGRPL